MPENDKDVEFTLSDLLEETNDFLSRLKRRLGVLLGIFLIFTVLVVLFLLFGKQQYTSTAIIAPPSPSPTSSMLSSMGGSSSMSGVRRLLGGGSSNADPFDLFQQVIGSDILYNDLAKKDGLLKVVFDKSWDVATDNWRKPPPVRQAILAVKGALGQPNDYRPGATQLQKMIDMRLNISQSHSPAMSEAASLAAISSNYLKVTYQDTSRERANLVLITILRRADLIIKSEMLGNINSRIKYIQSELDHTTNADQRTALIDTLTSQEATKAMVVADNPYSYSMISPPYASEIPTFPPGPQKMLLIDILLSLFVWGGLVFAESHVPAIQSFFRRLGCK